MSVSLWAYEPIECDDEFCCGDCDSCNHIPSHETDMYDEKVREKQLEYALLLMVYQYCVDMGDNTMYHQFMSAGEEAFRVLGITLGTPVAEIERRIDELESEGY